MWLREYNEERPHDSLGDMTPREYLLTQTPEVSTYGPKLGRVTEGLPESCEQKTCAGKAGSKFSESTNIGTLEMCISLATAPLLPDYLYRRHRDHFNEVWRDRS